MCCTIHIVWGRYMRIIYVKQKDYLLLERYVEKRKKSSTTSYRYKVFRSERHLYQFQIYNYVSAPFTNCYGIYVLYFLYIVRMYLHKEWRVIFSFAITGWKKPKTVYRSESFRPFFFFFFLVLNRPQLVAQHIGSRPLKLKPRNSPKNFGNSVKRKYGC